MTQCDSQSAPGVNPLRGDIAIVGMGCVFAGASNVDSYWQNIISKFDAVTDPPADEWDPKLFYDPEAKSNDRVYCKRGGYIGDLSRFQPLDFGVMPVMVDGGEPDQWLALRVAQEALADAGYTDPPREHVKTEVILGKGTYVNRGNLTVGYHAMLVEYFLQALKNLHPEHTESEIRQIKEELKAGLPPFSADTAPALIGNIIAGRISNRLDLMGPSFTVDAACASALLAIDIGVRDLLSQKCDLVLAGGANVNVPLPTTSLFCQLGALSRREQIRPFDKDADGTLLGGGIGMIVLKRKEDAQRDGNRIYALVKGVGVASDGRALHVMAPRVEGEELALRRAYEMAGVSPETVGLIEAHGTATPVGDVVEVQALRGIFGGRRGPLPTCALGSVKSMIGHTMPAAGIAGVIKTALALYHRVLPPTLHCDEPNPALQLDKTPFYVNTETRPWIHGAETPRRAGVNSFGFGGINAHVVLEEHHGELPAARNHQLHWDSEVCILEAESRNALIERVGRLQEYLKRSEEAPLKDIAYTLNSRLEAQPSRLAVVATSKEDLAQKLALACKRLAESECRQIKDNAGIYFFDRPLEGKLAFLFPGEGAQYPNMLLDLCLHFPEVRNCFDVADRALTHGSRDILPSGFIFPRSILSQAERAGVEQGLWQIDGAVEAVLIGNWAMWTLLSRLEIRPDVILGHSTGDYSAMLASHIIDLADEVYVERILEWNKAHSRLAQQMTVPKVTLVAVAADASTVRSIIDEVGGDLHLTMDNCPHQTVLVGSPVQAARAIDHLRSRGIIYEILPFDRPYHTPLFQAYADGAGEEFFARLPVSAPKIETYSCTTVAPYPAEVEEIRKLFVAHWVRPVQFTQTITRMYDSGVRLFVEAGPRGNLTAFVSDILRGKPHLAMPANLSRRSGLAQINHLVGVLAAQGVGLRLDYLYTRRNPQLVAWEDTIPSRPVKRQSGSMNVALALPALKVTLRKQRAIPQEHLAAEPLPRNSRAPEMPGLRSAAPLAVEAPRGTNRPRAHAAGAASTLPMKEYFKAMESFLDVETQVMGAFLERVRTGEPGSVLPSSPAPRDFPMLGTITSISPGKELMALRRITQEDDLFLHDHALGGPVSVLDPELRALVVIPLTMSLEILAEAASALMPGQILLGMRDIHAHQWIRVDDAPVNLQISARRMAGSTREVAVQIQNLTDASDKGRTPVVEGIVIFGDTYPPRPTPSVFTLNGERTSRLASTELYGRLMFHGPSFQGVASVERSGQNGVIGQLRILPAGNLFGSIANPRFVTDPVVLDAAGQLVGFWAAEYLPRGFVVFPYHLDTLRIYGPRRATGDRLTCRVRLQLKGSEGIRSDMEIIGADGAVWMELQGWADRRFDPPKDFHQAWIAPDTAMMSEPWEALVSPLRHKGTFECYRLESFFEPGASFWKELWASLVLSRLERRTFGERRGPEPTQIQWLSGRTVAKDTVRSYLRNHHRLHLLPADIEIGQDEKGRPTAKGLWTQHVPAVPRLSLAEAGKIAVALVDDGSSERTVGIDVQVIRELEPDFEGSALTPEEQHLLNVVPPSLRVEWLLRICCAKQAVSKALGNDVLGGFLSVRIGGLNLETGEVDVTPEGKLAVPAASSGQLRSYTARHGDYVGATAVYEERTS
jgi:acyl transferase domain-containing protein/phosphopantetheinyl transferase